jgi:hypothetical protein
MTYTEKKKTERKTRKKGEEASRKQDKRRMTYYCRTRAKTVRLAGLPSQEADATVPTLERFGVS